MASDGKLVFDTKVDTSGFDSGVQGLAGKAKAAGQGISGVANLTKNAVVASTKAMGAGLTAFGAYSLKAGASFDAGMSEVQAISGASGKDLEALRDKAKEMGATTKFSATQSAEALKYMAMAGWDSQSMLAGLPGVMNLAAASGEDLGLVSDIVTDSLTAFGLKAEDTGRFVDVLAATSSGANTNVSMLGESFKYAAPVAGALGYTVEDTALALGLMANAGIKSSMAGTTLRSAMTRLAKPTKEVEEYMDQLGITVTDNEGNMLPFNDVLLQLRDSFSGLSEEQQAQAASALFGKQAMAGMLAVINASDEDFNKLRDSINNSTGAAEAMAKVMNDNLKGDFTIMMSALEGLGISLYENLDKPMRAVVQNVTKQLDILNKTVQEDIGSLPTVLGNMMADGVVAIANYAPRMIETGTNIILSFLDGIQSNSDRVADSAVQIIISLAMGLLQTGARLLEVGGELVLKIGQGLADNADTIAPRALEIIGRLADSFVKALPKMIKIGADIVKGIAKGLKDNPEVVAQAVPAILKALTAAFLLFNGASIGKSLLKSIATGLSGNHSLITSEAGGIVGKLTKAFNSKGSELKSAGGKLIGHLADGIKKVSEPIVDAGSNTVMQLASAVLKGKDKLLAPGKALVNTIKTGIDAAGESTLATAGKSLVSHIGSGFSKGFGFISSTASKIIPLIAGVLSNPVGLVAAGGLLIGAIIKGFDIDVPKLTHSAGEIVGKIAGTISNGANKLVDVGKGLVGKISDGWDSVKDTVSDIQANGLINTLGSKLKSAGEKLKETGSGFIQGIKDGWNSKKGEAVEEAGQLPNEINNSIDPSSTNETGQTMVDGVIEGLRWGQSSVSEAYRELINNGVSESDAKAILRQEGSVSVQEYAQGILESTGSAKEAYAALMSEGLSEMDAAEQFFEIAGINMDSFINGTEEGGQTYREKMQELIDNGKTPLEAVEELYEIGRSNSDNFVQGAEAGGQGLQDTFNRMIQAGFTELEVIDQMYQKGQLNVDAFGQGSAAGLESIKGIYQSLIDSGLEPLNAVETLQNMGLMNAQGFAQGTGEGKFDVDSAYQALIDAGLEKARASEIMSQAGRDNASSFASGVSESEGTVSGAYDNAFAKPFSIMDFFRGDPTQREGRKTGEKYATGIGESKGKVETEAQGVMQTAEQAFTKETQAQAKGRKVGSDFASGITSSKTGVETASKNVGNSAYTGLNNQSEKFRGAGDKSMSAYAQGLGQQKGNVINSVNDMGNQINNSLNKTSNQSSQTASQMMSKISNSVNKGSSQVTQAVSQMSNKVNSEVKRMGSQAQQSSTDMMNKMSQSVKTGTNKINQDFKRMSTQITSTVKSTSNQVTSSGRQMMSQFTSSIKSGANNSVSAIKSMGSRMVASVNGYRGQFQSAGYNLMAGLRGGINSGSSGVINAAISVMNRAVSAAKRAASIHSPSRVWRDEVGKMLPAGMAEGIDAMSNKAVNAAKNMMNSVRNEASNAVNVEVNANTKNTLKKVGKTSEAVSDIFTTSIIESGIYTAQTVGNGFTEAGNYVTNHALYSIDDLTNHATTTVGNKLTSSTAQFEGYASSTIDNLATKSTKSIGNNMISANTNVTNQTTQLIRQLTNQTTTVLTNELTKSANIISNTITNLIRDLTNEVNNLISRMEVAGSKATSKKIKSSGFNAPNLNERIKNWDKVSDAKLDYLGKTSSELIDLATKLRKYDESERDVNNKDLDKFIKDYKTNLELIEEVKKARKQQAEASKDKTYNTPYDSEELVHLSSIKTLSNANLKMIDKLKGVDEANRDLSNRQLKELEDISKSNIDFADKMELIKTFQYKYLKDYDDDIKSDSYYRYLDNIEDLSSNNLSMIKDLRNSDRTGLKLNKTALNTIEEISKDNIETVRQLRDIRQAQDKASQEDMSKIINNARASVQDQISKDMEAVSFTTIHGYGYGSNHENLNVKVENGDVTTVIELDGKEVGRAVAPIVSREISKDRRRRKD